MVDIPSELNVMAAYPIAALKASPQPQPGARNSSTSSLAGRRRRVARGRVRSLSRSVSADSTPRGRRTLWAVAWPGAIGLLRATPAPRGAPGGRGCCSSSPPRQLLAGLSDPLVVPALRLTLFTTTVSLLATARRHALAWLIARRTTLTIRADRTGRSERRQPDWRLLETLVELPVVLPPAVAGVALLLAFGRRGLLGPVLGAWGSACRSRVRPWSWPRRSWPRPSICRPRYRRLSPPRSRLLLVARTLGASPPRVLFRIVLPLRTRD